jgi:hypothetical protein
LRVTRETTDIEHVGLEDTRQPDIFTREIQIRSASAAPAYATDALSEFGPHPASSNEERSKRRETGATLHGSGIPLIQR